MTSSAGHAPTSLKDILILPVIVAALGYFVDVLDIWLFAVNRIASLKDIGVPADQLFDQGLFLLNMQMGGLFLGGLLFGVLGDRFGRTRIMFLSILAYSLGTLANAFVTDVNTYAALRFISGFGLAGELGLSITLISEILPKEKRGYGTGLIVSFGVLGAVAAAGLAHIFPWRVNYAIGGVLGLLLLLFRMKVAESGLFNALPASIPRGKLMMLFANPTRLLRFIRCVCLVLPIWYVAGILSVFAPEIIKEKFNLDMAAATLILFSTLALSAGDFGSAWMSQMQKNRTTILVQFTFLALIASMFFLICPWPLNKPLIIILYCLMSFGTGCWVLGVTTTAESFGTNLRATVTTAVPNFSRAAVIPMTLSVAALKNHMPLVDAVFWVGLVVFALAFWAIWGMKETFGKCLNYVEE